MPRRPSKSFAPAALALGTLLVAAACEREPIPATPPRQLSESPFQYPEELWDAGVEGETTLKLYIAPDGGVDSARVARGSGYAAFDSAALAGSRSLRFAPATEDGKPVGKWFLLPVKFELTPADSAAASTKSP